MNENFKDQQGPWSQEKLMSFVLNGTSRYQSVDELARRLNAHFISMEQLVQADEAALKSIKGIGPVKAKQILAMLELHKLWNTPQSMPSAIKKSTDAVPYFDNLRYLSHEEFHVLYLNRAHIPISCLDLFRGGITGTVTDVRIVLKRAIELGATAMIVAHNHPSGALKPSENDKRMTRKLVDAAQTLDLNLLDHLIVTRSGYFSFSDQGMM
jgi:DNA repair protein RadC